MLDETKGIRTTMPRYHLLPILWSDGIHFNIGTLCLDKLLVNVRAFSSNLMAKNQRISEKTYIVTRRESQQHYSSIHIKCV